MAFAEVNGARLYYEPYDSPQPGRTPIILIHGFPQTGAADWGFLASILARDKYVPRQLMNQGDRLAVVM